MVDYIRIGGSRMPPCKEIIIPSGGWLPHTWYLIDVSYSSGNPVHRSILYTGFLNGKNNVPGNYHCIMACNGGSDISYICAVYYLDIIKIIVHESECRG